MFISSTYLVKSGAVERFLHGPGSIAPGYPFFSFSGPNLVDSSLIFKDGQFEDVSEVEKQFVGNIFFLMEKIIKQSVVLRTVKENIVVEFLVLTLRVLALLQWTDIWKIDMKFLINENNKFFAIFAFTEI